MDLTLLDTPTDRDWRSSANCLDVDPEVMQPEVATAEDVRMATRVCLGCPVRRECRELAEGQAGAYGVHDAQWRGEPPRRPDGHCEQCGRAFSSHRATARFCGSTCRQAHRRAEAAKVPA